MSHSTVSNLSCPVPIGTYKQILLAHGGGGKLTHQLIQEMIAPQFANELLSPLHDGAVFSVKGGHLAFSTDSFVVNPIFFPGGTIGDLAVNGTVNDLAMCGAKPRYLSAAFIIEEGMTMEELWRVIVSMKDAADRAGVMLVTGDTKVVDRGKGDKIFITTSGVGILEDGVNIHPANARPGDVVILSGPIGLHGIAVLSIREGLEFETEIVSDT
ncbi:MAG: hydrogenase expression/formation protein HypE, partial [Ignavibacterium sp.]